MCFRVATNTSPEYRTSPWWRVGGANWPPRPISGEEPVVRSRAAFSSTNQQQAGGPPGPLANQEQGEGPPEKGHLPNPWPAPNSAPPSCAPPYLWAQPIHEDKLLTSIYTNELKNRSFCNLFLI